MKLILHNYRRCPFCIRTRIVLYLKNIEYELVNEQLRDWTEWMSQQTDPRVPMLREIRENGQEIVHRESNNINLWLDSNFGKIEFTPEQDAPEYKSMLDWWEWCAAQLKPTIDLYKYGEDRVFDKEKHPEYVAALRTLLGELEIALVGKNYLLQEKLTLADIAIIPFIRQIMRTRNGEFDFTDFPRTKVWAGLILEQEWFRDTIMRKNK